MEIFLKISVELSHEPVISHWENCTKNIKYTFKKISHVISGRLITKYGNNLNV